MRYEKNYIHKDNAYEIIKAFAKEYRRINGERIPAEIIIVGGGSILLNYGFREFTQDFDIMVSSTVEIKDIVHKVADQFNLFDDWMNTDFKNTISYSDKLRKVSKHKYSFNHGSLEIRTVKDEYLIAMKMVAARSYRNDISDIIGILLYAQKAGNRITMEQIDHALSVLYDNPGGIVREELFRQVERYTNMDCSDLYTAYWEMKDKEKRTKEDIVEISEKYPDVVAEKSVESIIEEIRKKRGN